MLNPQNVSAFELFDVFRHFGEHLRRCSPKPQKTRRRSRCSHREVVSTFGQIRAARVLAGLSQRQLAVAAGLHPNSIKNWERRDSSVGGFAVSRIIEALEKYGVRCGVEYSGGSSVGVLRG